MSNHMGGGEKTNKSYMKTFCRTRYKSIIITTLFIIVSLYYIPGLIYDSNTINTTTVTSEGLPTTKPHRNDHAHHPLRESCSWKSGDPGLFNFYMGSYDGTGSNFEAGKFTNSVYCMCNVIIVFVCKM